MKEQFTIIGAGGHAKVVVEIVEEAGGAVCEVVDSNTRLKELMGYPVTRDRSSEALVLLAIGNNQARKDLSETAAMNFGTAIHPRANVSRRCTMGEGTVVMAGVTINAQAVLGKHCIINTNASIDHDCAIGDFVHISPNASLAGNVTVGEGTHIGIGSTVIQGIQIGKWVTIGAGSVIIKDVPDYAVVVGVPGMVIKFINPKEKNE